MTTKISRRRTGSQAGSRMPRGGCAVGRRGSGCCTRWRPPPGSPRRSQVLVDGKRHRHALLLSAAPAPGAAEKKKEGERRRRSHAPNHWPHRREVGRWWPRAAASAGGSPTRQPRNTYPQVRPSWGKSPGKSPSAVPRRLPAAGNAVGATAGSLLLRRQRNRLGCPNGALDRPAGGRHITGRRSGRTTRGEAGPASRAAGWRKPCRTH